MLHRVNNYILEIGERFNLFLIVIFWFWFKLF